MKHSTALLSQKNKTFKRPREKKAAGPSAGYTDGCFNNLSME